MIQPDLSGHRALVTGGTGFIGGRLVETLVLKCGAAVRVLTHNLAHAARIARLPVDLVKGDVTEGGDMNRAVADCDLVFHCAYGNEGSMRWQRRVNVQGTRNTVSAAARAGVKRIVHVSTAAVHGHIKAGGFDESAPLRYTGNAYADSKLDAEKIAFSVAARHGLPLSVVRPTIVYGPFSPTWTVGVINQLKSGRAILLNGGNGRCNAVYIDDVVQSMLLAATRGEAVGEAFLISSEVPVTWRDFYQSFERMLGESRTVSMSTAEAKAFQRQSKKSRSLLSEVLAISRQDPRILRRLLQTNEVEVMAGLAEPMTPQLKRILRTLLRIRATATGSSDGGGGEPPIDPMDSWSIRFFESAASVRIDKAKRLLGYRPSYDFALGMKLTEKWARWANLIGP